MKISPFILVGSVLTLTLAFGTGCSSGGGSGTPEERRFADALEKAHGDPSKLNPEDKKMFDEWIKKNPSPTSSPGPGGSPRGGSAPGGTR